MKGESFRTTWGANRAEDGSAHFRLWAPALDELWLDFEDQYLPMERENNGWFSLQVPSVAVGTPYCFILPDGMKVPDPASRAQLSDVHGPSVLTSSVFDWRAESWVGRPWEEAIIYELHVGAFTPQGSFDGVMDKLDHIASAGFTAIELMPVAQFSGTRGWGYDGVLPYCPHSAYGGANGLKRLVDAAHQRGLMVFLDVVYNHFGPDGNYLNAYAPEFFAPGRETPWGPAIRFEEPAVRAFFLENPLYWLHEFRFDGLRFDAIDQIKDESETPILEEMADAIRTQFPGREIHLMTEDERNIITLHPRDEQNRPLLFTAEWNDDFHHAAHCIATGESAGYYAAFADDPVSHLARALTEGFCYQGEAYGPREGKPRGEPSAGQPPSAFVAFLQNHDQIGNRAFGERLTTLAELDMVELLTAILLLNPQIPLVFMGEEFGETNPFLFFTDFHGVLAHAVREGRRREFADFDHFSEKKAEHIPDPNALSTFQASMFNWDRAATEPAKQRLALFRRLIEARRAHIIPHLAGMKSLRGQAVQYGKQALSVRWRMGEGNLLLCANLGPADLASDDNLAGFDAIFESRDGVFASLADGWLPASSVAVAAKRGGSDDR